MSGKPGKLTDREKQTYARLMARTRPYRGRLILYGCGDLVDDYEGITGYEGFRDDLRLLHLARIDHDSGALLGLEMVPFQARRLRLWRAGARDVAWLAQTLGESCELFGTSVGVRDDTLHLEL